MPSNFKVLAGASGEPIDPNFRNVTLLLHGDGNNGGQNNAFVDSSSNHFPISRNGNTTQGSFSPYGSNWGCYFDGNADWLSVSDSSAFGFGTGDFTIEAWVFCSFNGAIQTIVDGRPSTTATPWALSVSSTGLARSYDGTVRTGGQLTANQWNHIAWVRASGVNTVYVNGVSGHSWTNSGDYGSSRPLNIGRTVSPETDYFGGYISNLRIVKGTAVYTSAFTPSTTPLTVITNTSLLTCAYNRFRDGSTNNFTVTRNGDVKVTNFAPFAPSSAAVYDQNDVQYWSGAFDGTGDYLTVADNTALQMSGSFTWEAWVYPLTLPGSGYKTLWGQRANAGAYGGPLVAIDTSGNILLFIANDNATGWTVVNFDTGFDISLNTWQHIALVKNGSTITLYKDGVAGSATTHATAVGTSGSLSIMAGTADGSQAVDGYMSNFRIVKGTAVYTSNFTPPTAPLTAISGTSLLTCQNASFTDNSANKFAITANGNATVVGNSPYNPAGYWSNSFDGSGDWLTIPSNTAFSIGTGQFTLECWIYFNTVTNINEFLWADASGTTGGRLVMYYSGGSLQIVAAGGAGGTSASWTPVAGRWYHIAASRDASNNQRLFVDGALLATATSTNNYTENGFAIARSGTFNGHISNVRLVKGSAVYTGNFTPPTSPLTAISGTSLLTCQANRFIDSSANAFTITPNGNVAVSDFDPFTGASVTSTGGSAYFDGSGDDLRLASNSAFSFGTGDFTIEGWCYLSSNTGNYRVIVSIPHSSGWLQVRFGGSTEYNSLFQVSVLTTAASNVYSTQVSQANAVGRWMHFAFTRSGSTCRIFLDGVQQNLGTGTNPTSFPSSSFSDSTNISNNNTVSIGNDIPNSTFYIGNLSGVRILKGTAQYTANFTPPTSPPTAITNTSLLTNFTNAAIFDNSMKNDIETVGNAQISTSVKKFGTGSMYFDGSGDALTIPASTELTFGTGDFTMEMWIYSGANGTSTRTMGNGAGASWSANKWVLGTGDAQFVNKFIVGCNNATSTSALLWSTTTFNDSTWKHVAITRSGNTWRLFVNGTQEATATSSASLDGGIPATITVGRSGISGDADWAGYIDELRLTKGVARYTANFTAPTAPFPNK